MQKVKTYKCPHCGAKYKSLQTWGSHIQMIHPNIIPHDWSTARYFYYIQTGKKNGNCIECHNPTEWNEATKKYGRFCHNPKCKEIYRAKFKNRMIEKYGKIHLLNDPNQQRKMIANRRISGIYTFKDGTKHVYTGKYEKDFLYMLDKFLSFSGSDIMSPSPHTYEYNYKNPHDKEHEGKHFYIPDFYIPSINLEIEIKENSNKHPKILRIDKVKEYQKDETMKSIPNINYIKIVEKDYTNFFKLLDSIIDTPHDENKVAIEAVNSIPSLKNASKNILSYNLDRLQIEKYKKYFNDLKNIEKNNSKDYFGKIFVYGDVPIGYYIVDKEDNLYWLSNFEIKSSYRNTEYEKYILLNAIRFGKFTNIKILKSYEAIINILIDNGFIIYSEESEYLYMGK